MRKTILKWPLVLLISCFTSFLQAQDFDAWFGSNFMLNDFMDAEKGYCLDLEGFAYTVDPTAPVIVHSCKEGLWKDGTWRVDYPNPGQIYIPDYERCLAAGGMEQEAEVFIGECSDDPMQQFTFRDDGLVQLAASGDEGLCLGVAEESRRVGNNMRRQTQMVNCQTTDLSLSQWILPAEDAEYHPVEFTPLSLLPLEQQQPPGGAAMGGAGMAPAMGAGGPGGNAFGACSTCHGPTGNGYPSEHSPKISGQADWYLSRQISNFVRDIRGNGEGERWATQMSFHIKDFTQAQLDGYVELIGTFEDVPAEVTISGDQERGQQLYAQTCLACHGETAMGNEALGSPRLAGMSDWYMVAQLEKFRTGYRGAHPDDEYGVQMAPFAKILPDDQSLLDVVSYINTLAPQ